MFTLLMLIMAVLILVFFFLNCRCIGNALTVSIFLLFFAVACGPVPIWLLNKLQSSYIIRPAVDWGERNAIVLLGASSVKIPETGKVEPNIFSYARLAEGAAQYNDCRQKRAICKIIISGGDPKGNGVAEAISYRDTLLGIGVNSADIITETNSNNTWQNAQFTSDILRDTETDRVALVTSGFHMDRSILYFRHFDVSVTPVRADYISGELSLLPLSYNLAITDYALQEYIGILRYYVYNAFGWNVPRRGPLPA